MKKLFLALALSWVAMAVTTASAADIPVKVSFQMMSDSAVNAVTALDGEQPVEPLKISIGDAVNLRFSGYAQVDYDYINEHGITSNDFNIRRVILMAEAQFTPKLTAFVMVDAANSTYAKHLQEFYIQYAFVPQFKLRIGQFKQPFMLENIISPRLLGTLSMNESTRYLAGIAGDPLYGNMAGRDLGLMASGDLFRAPDGHYWLNYSAGIFNGAGLNVRDNNRHKDFIAMLNVRPVEGLTVSTSCIVGKGRARNDSPFNTVEEGEDYTRNRWSAGLEYKRGRVNLRGEWAWGKDGKVNSRGGYVELALRTLPKLDLVLDFDHLNTNTTLSRAEQEMLPRPTSTCSYLVGLQYWVYKRCRVASQYVFRDRRTGPDMHEWITQVQVSF